jgi:hypothetical protein
MVPLPIVADVCNRTSKIPVHFKPPNHRISTKASSVNFRIYLNKYFILFGRIPAHLTHPSLFETAMASLIGVSKSSLVRATKSSPKYNFQFCLHLFPHLNTRDLQADRIRETSACLLESLRPHKNKF